MQTGMNIGTVVDKESLSALTDSLVRLMEAKADQKTIREAFRVVERVARVEGMTISHCNITGDRKTEIIVENDGQVSFTTPPPAPDTTGIRVD